MTIRNWVRTRRILKARRKAEGDPSNPLREFVYVDEVSVYSLIASRRGPVATEFTDIEAASLRAEVTGSAEASAGVLKGTLGSTLEQSTNKSAQVVRKSTVQSTFRSLYNSERQQFAMLADIDTELPAPLSSLPELGALAAKPEYRGLVIPVAQVERGQLSELRLQLDAESTFKVATIISTLVGIVEEGGSFIPNIKKSDVAMASTMYEILNRLLAGLIPVRGTALDYFVIDQGESSYIVRKELLSGVADLTEDRLGELSIVGVADANSFWKDYRQVLFSGSAYTALCRVAGPGIRPQWQPLKMVELIGTTLPGFRDAMETFGDAALAAMAGSRRTDPQMEDPARGRSALEAYARVLCSMSGDELTSDQLNAFAANWPRNETPSIRSIRAAFEVVTRYFAENHGLNLDAVEATNLRSSVLERAGLTPDGRQATPTVTPRATVAPTAAPADAKFLEVEFVSIYW